VILAPSRERLRWLRHFSSRRDTLGRPPETGGRIEARAAPRGGRDRMKRAMSSRSAILAALSLLVAFPAAAEDERPDWMPYIELAVDLHEDRINSQVRTPVPAFQIYSGFFPYSNTPVGFSGRLGVLSPKIELIPAAPRVFLDAGVYATPETNEIIFDRGNLDASLGAQEGSRIRRRFRNPAAAAGLGLEFTLPWVQERFRLKPSVEYEWEKIRVQGRFAFDFGGAIGVNDFREQREEDYHQLGWGLESEMVVYGGLSLYVDLRMLWVVSGSELISFSNEPDNVTWTYVRRHSALHGAFGFRYAYQGF